MAQAIAKNGPIGVRSAKSAINTGIEIDLRSALNVERLNYLRVLNSEDRIEGLKAFNEKRAPRY